MKNKNQEVFIDFRNFFDQIIYYILQDLIQYQAQERLNILD
jgi:hypothetical protein